MTREPCDCLVRCGDDPALREGKAEPCDTRRREQLHLARAARIHSLLQLMNLADTLEALEQLAVLRGLDIRRIT